MKIKESNFDKIRSRQRKHFINCKIDYHHYHHYIITELKYLIFRRETLKFN